MPGARGRILNTVVPLAALLLAVLRPVPGVVIDYIPAEQRRYVGSPSLAILPNGDYVACHDEFGPESGERTRGVTRVFRSGDRGQTWRAAAAVEGAFWSTLFFDHGVLYLMGTDRDYGDLVIRASRDGTAWSPPSVLLGGGRYHTAPVPVVAAGGRLWRAFERIDRTAGTVYGAGVMSAREGDDLTRPTSWTATNLVPSNPAWNGGDMPSWREGNAVVAPGGGIVDVIRVDTHSSAEKAAILQVSANGRTTRFDPADGFVDFPGGAKKFTIRFDPKGGQYWSLASIVENRYRDRSPGSIRNTLALTSSPDLVHWTVRRIVAHSADVRGTGFQYADWLFDGDDIAAVVRTAFGGAHTEHDANYLTFMRIENFRQDPGGTPSPR